MKSSATMVSVAILDMALIYQLIQEAQYILSRWTGWSATLNRNAQEEKWEVSDRIFNGPNLSRIVCTRLIVRLWSAPIQSTS